MPLNSSGPISLGGATVGQSVNLELGFAATATITMNTTAVRTLAGFPTAGTQYSMSNFYGKSNRPTASFTYTTSTQNAALNVGSLSGYSAGTTDITVTVNAGIYLWASTTANYGLTLTGGTTGDTVKLVNNGYIMGRGGNGRTNTGGDNAGLAALNVGIGVSTITIDNTNASAYIGGGGGGGCCGNNGPIGGGGAGGGNSGGNGGAIGATGNNGNVSRCCGNGTCRSNGGGGGRIFPGNGGSGTSGGAGGRGGGAGGGGGGDCGTSGASGGAGSAAGGNIGTGIQAGSGGGGWGASGGNNAQFCFSGGAGGKAVNLNGKSVTWVSGNTTRVWGTVS
jgi:hypothetical protein